MEALLIAADAPTVDSGKAITNGSTTPEQNAPRFVPRIIRLSDIDRDENQPRATPRSEESRESLTQSVQRDGLFSALLVRPGAAGRFILVSGEGRYDAALACGHTEALCLVCEAPLSPAELRRMQFAENVFRETLNPLDQAALFRSLMRERRWSQTRVADFLGVSQGHVSEYVNLLRLPADIRDRVAKGTLGVRAAPRVAKRRAVSTVDTADSSPENVTSPFAGENPLHGITVHPLQSWVDNATGIRFLVGRKSKRAVSDKDLLRALKSRVKDIEARLASPAPPLPT